MSKDVTYRKHIQSKRWRDLRNVYIREHPRCSECGRMAQCVHHITPCETAQTEERMLQLMFNPYNLQALCYDCHAKIHKAERSHTKEIVKERAEERNKRFIDKFL